MKFAEMPAVGFDVTAIRRDFPVLSRTVYGKPLIYLDNAATSQKPKQVIDALVDYYSNYNANIHRGIHFLSQAASGKYDAVRGKAAVFINAASEEEIVFTSGTTDSINLVASSYGRTHLKEGDEVLVSEMEHHSNIVPWQLICNERKATLRVIRINESGELDLSGLNQLINSKTKIVSVVHTSNSLGTINPVKEIIKAAHKYNAVVLIDGAQAAAHEVIDVQDLDCDFFAFSAHKMLGPTGTGALYGKRNLLDEMPPYKGGGDMIRSVSFENTTWNDVPYKFEAGTPNIADVIAWGAAFDYYASLDRKAIAVYEQELVEYATEKLKQIPEVRIIGNAKHKTAVISFILKDINAMDAGMYLDTKGIAVRTGQHCTEPVMDCYKIPGTIRASFMFYNTIEEADILVEEVRNAVKLLSSRSK